MSYLIGSNRKTRSARTYPKLFDFISISLESLNSACPVKFLPSETNLLLMFNRGFEEDKRSEFNWGPPISVL